MKKRFIAILAVTSFVFTACLFNVFSFTAFADESTVTANDQQVTVKFEFNYAKKAPVEVVLNKGESLGDKLPTFSNVTRYIDSKNSNAELELAGYTADGQLFDLDELRNMNITKDTEFSAYYMVHATFKYVLYDGREESKQMSPDELEKSLTVMSLFDEGTGKQYKGEKLKRISYEKQTTKMGDRKIVSRYQYEGVVRMPLTDLNGKLVEYNIYDEKVNATYNQPFVKTPFVSGASSANPYGGSITIKTNYSPWFWVKVSDASAANPVDVKVKFKQSYPNSYQQKLVNAEKNFTVTLTNNQPKYKMLSDKTDDPADVIVSNDYWKSNGNIYTATDYGPYPIVDRNAYGGVVLTAEPQEMKGYTLIKQGDGTSDNSNQRYQDAFYFAYFKNLNFKFNAKAGGTTISQTDADIADITMLHTRKVDKNKIPTVNPVSNKTFVGWADKNAPDTVIDFTNMTAERDMEFVPVFDNAPVINAKDISVNINDAFDPLKNVSAYDDEDGIIKLSKANITDNDVNTSSAGTYHITYKVTDSKGNITKKQIAVTVKDNVVKPNNPSVDNSNGSNDSNVSNGSTSSSTNEDVKSAVNSDKNVSAKKQTAKTNDNFNIDLLLCILVISLTALPILVFKYKHK